MFLPENISPKTETFEDEVSILEAMGVFIEN